jgi:hypothetical protein
MKILQSIEPINIGSFLVLSEILTLSILGISLSSYAQPFCMAATISPSLLGLSVALQNQ